MTMSQNQYQYEQDLKNLGLGENKKLVIEGKDCIVYRHPVHGTLNGYLKLQPRFRLEFAIILYTRRVSELRLCNF